MAWDRRRLIALILLGVMLLSLPLGSGASYNPKKRVIADTTSFLYRLLFRLEGCSIVHELNDATSLRCPASVAARHKLRDERLFHILDLYAGQMIGADKVWSEYDATGKGVVIAVLDTGVDYRHRELSSSVVGGASFVSYTPFYLDDHGHGTHVAGVIAGDGAVGKAKGIARDAGLWIAKVCDSSGFCWESDIAAALEYLVEEKVARIVSITVGGGGTAGEDCDQDYLARKVNWASREGLLVVAASGNAGSYVASPACASEAVAVGAVDKNNRPASFSGRGLALDLVAPGVGIYSTSPGGGYATRSGTSLAASVVSGVAALLLEGNSSYGASELKEALYSSAVDLGYDRLEQGHGRVDARRALERLNSTSR